MKFFQAFGPVVLATFFGESSAFPARDSSLFPRAPPPGQDVGVWKFDCADAAGACNNACYYQNCLNKGRTVTYYDGGGKKDNAVTRRIQSGAKANNAVGAICRSPPIAQSQYDQQGANEDLETDEWPMAAMWQEDFQQGHIRNSLRCINNGENSAGGRMYMNFRNGKGSHYGANGDWKSSRTKPPGQALKEGDHFTVQFENVDVHKSPYCAPNPTCENDGFQFHMTSLKENGIMKAPYDPDESNTYRITDQSGDLNHYHVRVTRSGNGAKDAKVELWGYGGDTKHSKGTQHTTNFDAGHDFEVHGFPKSLFIKPKDNKLDGELDFRYHEKNQPINHDKYAYFEWTTNSKGRYSSTASNKYCEGKSSGQGAQAKHVWDCRFPGY